MCGCLNESSFTRRLLHVSAWRAAVWRSRVCDSAAESRCVCPRELAELRARLVPHHFQTFGHFLGNNAKWARSIFLWRVCGAVVCHINHGRCVLWDCTGVHSHNGSLSVRPISGQYQARVHQQVSWGHALSGWFISLRRASFTDGQTNTIVDKESRVFWCG